MEKGKNKKKEEKPIGRITHYFDKIGVAVVKLSAPLAVGESIRIEGGEETDFQQKVESMEVEHEKIKKAKRGSEIGLKIKGKKKVREGYRVYKA